MRSAFSKRGPDEQISRAFALELPLRATGFDMTNHTAHEQTRLSHLLAAYKAAFGEWSLQVRLLQTLGSHSTTDRTALQKARAQVRHAQATYRGSRDLLADFMLVRLSNIKASCGRRTSPAVLTELESRQARDANSSGMDQRSQVERMAYCLWQGAGCPAGSADADWYRAEQLIRDRTLTKVNSA